MRFMLIFKASRHSEAGVKPACELAEAMKACYEDMARAGVLIAAERLYPSSQGLKLTYPVAGGRPKVNSGPFEEVIGLVAGIMMIEVKTKEEAYEWTMRLPDPHGYGDGEIELRQVCDSAQWFCDPGLRLLEADLRDQMDMISRR